MILKVFLITFMKGQYFGVPYSVLTDILHITYSQIIYCHMDMDQQTGSKLERSKYLKAVYCYLAYLTFMQSTSRGVLDWMKHKLEPRLPGEISITSDDITLMAEIEEKL